MQRKRIALMLAALAILAAPATALAEFRQVHLTIFGMD